MEYIFLLGPIIFVIVTSVLGRITPNYNNQENYISELSLGAFGFIQKINFIICGLMITALCMTIALHSPNWTIRTGWFFGAITGLAIIALGIWDTDYGLSKRTFSGKVHEAVYSRVVVAVVAIAYLILGWGYRNNLHVLIVTIFTFLVSLIVHTNAERLGIRKGVVQRITVFLAIIWIELMAIFTLNS